MYVVCIDDRPHSENGSKELKLGKVYTIVHEWTEGHSIKLVGIESSLWNKNRFKPYSVPSNQEPF